MLVPCGIYVEPLHLQQPLHETRKPLTQAHRDPHTTQTGKKCTRRVDACSTCRPLAFATSSTRQKLYLAVVLRVTWICP